eukprot:CAMPEP_0119561644 /NCGR_PEP_ID=MMETSP1352-20130426/18256_1 /TAXON_ID=265584 /ORGANISM="Stauroneis constricta, Strain CCMP1120" /LENGTH=612 /DNA_ID=CAMNT_0007609891 /DNA_START=274 /DNA_END=2112 /DNA_ORIENTATION=-
MPVPPRAITGNKAMPVLGHTKLFLEVGSELPTLFPPHWKEWRFMPCSRAIGDIFSVFLWGKWRVLIHGEDRVNQVLRHANLKQGWAWNEPKPLLGDHCFHFLDHDAETDLRNALAGPLSARNIQRFAPAFEAAAARCLNDISNFNDTRLASAAAVAVAKPSTKRRPSLRKSLSRHFSNDSIVTEDENKPIKLRFDALRSYAFDLIDGPILGLHMYSSQQQQQQQEQFEDEYDDDDSSNTKTTTTTKRNMMLLWMSRIKYGLSHIQIYLGANWMQMWRLSAYERAINARTHIHQIISSHVSGVYDCGGGGGHHHCHDEQQPPPIPPPTPITQRRRTRSFSEIDNNDTLRVRLLSSMNHATATTTTKRRQRAYTEPTLSRHHHDIHEKRSKTTSSIPQSSSLLQQIIQQQNDEIITKPIAIDISILLWFVLDIGQSWTYMAIHILSLLQEDPKIFLQSQKHMNALIYEAIRLCPNFLGGLYVTQSTMELNNIQIPKDTNIVLCSKNEINFYDALYHNKSPDDIVFPSVALNGFLPLKGLEIPLMVLQTKIFIRTFLKQNYYSYYNIPKRLSLLNPFSTRDIENNNPLENDETTTNIMKVFPFPEPKHCIMIRKS